MSSGSPRKSPPSAVGQPVIGGSRPDSTIRIDWNLLRQAWRILNERSAPASGSINAGLSKPHFPPFESWSWKGADEIDLDRLMAFARDPALNIYRLKGRFRLTDGRTVLLHKVGREITFEDAAEAFEKSEFVAIGTRPCFNPARTGQAWTQVLNCPNTLRS